MDGTKAWDTYACVVIVFCRDFEAKPYMYSKLIWHKQNKQILGDQACQQEGTRASFGQIFC